MGKIAKHLFQDQEIAQPKGCTCVGRWCKFIWYDQIDEFLSLTAKANGVLGAMDQGVPVPGTPSVPTNNCKETDGDGEPSWVQSPQRTNPETHSGAD